MEFWNPWHGCHKYSEGCKNCYVYRRDKKINKDSSIITKTKMFNYAIQKGKNGEYKINSGSTVFVCMTSDFFVEEADSWRKEIWQMIKIRKDISFTIITKRIVRFMECIPSDWDNGYDNVTIGCTVENQRNCDIRLPIFNKLPIKNKFIICEPLLETINLEKYLNSSISYVTVGGESGDMARVCDYDWVLDIRKQCKNKNIPFVFRQTGQFFKKDKVLYNITREKQGIQAKKANIDVN